MNKAEWLKKIDSLIEEIETDDYLDDEEKSDILTYLTEKATDSYNEFQDADNTEDDEDDEEEDEKEPE